MNGWFSLSYFRQDAHVTPVALLSRFASSDFFGLFNEKLVGKFFDVFSLGFCRARMVVLPRCHGVCCAGGSQRFLGLEG